ncbi:MAG: menaquinone biosynthesis protein [Planctomycetota bacterium]
MSQVRLLRVGNVPYLNARPLGVGLSSEAGLAVEEDLPSALVEKLRDARLDVAFVSSIEIFRKPGYRVIPGLGVASRGSVESVLLFHRAELADGCTLSLDTSSRTGEALVRIACERFLGLHGVRYRHDPPTVDPRTIPADGVLRIGDPAMRYAAAVAGEMERLDLGTLWNERTRLPFVYAMWVVAPGVRLGDRLQVFYRALERGLAERCRLAEEASRSLPLTFDQAWHYLADVIHYRLGEEDLEGLLRFRDLAAELGLARRDISLELVGEA